LAGLCQLLARGLGLRTSNSLVSFEHSTGDPTLCGPCWRHQHLHYDLFTGDSYHPQDLAANICLQAVSCGDLGRGIPGMFLNGSLWTMSSCLLLCCHFFDLCASFVAALLFKMVRRSNSSTPEDLCEVLKTFLLTGVWPERLFTTQPKQK